MPDLLTGSLAFRTTYTQSGLRDRVRSDTAQADHVFIADAEIDRWGLEAQNIIARTAEWYQFLETISTSGGVRDYPLPDDCISLSKVQWDIWPLQSLTLQELFALDPLWRNYGPSQPRFYVVGAGSRLILYPTPSAASGLLLIYSALPPAPLGDLDQYWAPVGGEEAITYYACLKLSLKDAGREGMKRADYFGKLWTNALARIAAQSRDMSEESGTVMGAGNLRHRRGIGRIYWPPASYRVGG